jgi:predicted SprT family Zn-dependent metalloprotease
VERAEVKALLKHALCHMVSFFLEFDELAVDQEEWQRTVLSDYVP